MEYYTYLNSLYHIPKDCVQTAFEFLINELDMKMVELWSFGEDNQLIKCQRVYV